MIRLSITAARFFQLARLVGMAGERSLHSGNAFIPIRVGWREKLPARDPNLRMQALPGTPSNCLSSSSTRHTAAVADVTLDSAANEESGADLALLRLEQFSGDASGLPLLHTGQQSKAVKIELQFKSSSRAAGEASLLIFLLH